MIDIQNQKNSLVDVLKKEQESMSVRYKSIARYDVIPGIDRLLENKTSVTSGDMIVRKDLLRIYFNSHLIIGSSEETAYSLTKIANSKLESPLSTHDFDSIIKYSGKIYTYNPSTVEKKLQLNQEEIDLADMTGKARKKAEERKRAYERRKIVFRLRQYIVVLYLKGITRPTEIFDNLPDEMRANFSERYVRDFLRELRLNKKNPNPRDLNKEPIRAKELLTHVYS